MPAMDDQQYLRSEQYRDAANLNARIDLHLRFSTNPYGWTRWVGDRLDLAPASRVLEVGCGPGTLWRDNRARLPADAVVTLGDLSPGMVAEARGHLGAGAAPFRFLVLDAQAIPFPDASFDTVLAMHMLYHVPDRARALAEIRRVLRPGGRFLAATNGQAHLAEIGDLLARFDPAVTFWRPLPAAPGAAPGVPFFDLEQGGAELARVFADVGLDRYPDSLVVTEAAPLVAYILSTSTAADLTGDRRAAVTRFVEQEIAAHGAIRIHKDAGLFRAR